VQLGGEEWEEKVWGGVALEADVGGLCMMGVGVECVGDGSSEDLQLWDENFYEPKVGGAAFVQQMLERGKLNNGEVLDYAFGLVHGTYRGLKTVEHAGSDAGYRSDMIRFPEQHLSVAVLCNSADTNPNRLTQQVADVVLAKEIAAAEKAGTHQQWGKTPGREQLRRQRSRRTRRRWQGLQGCIGIARTMHL
jgi:hypothetical protein